MVEVDGVKYISEKEFDYAVTAELSYVAKICTETIMEHPSIEAVESSMDFSGLIADAYANLRAELFKSKEDKKDE